jgi:hypothetical protein
MLDIGGDERCFVEVGRPVFAAAAARRCWMVFGKQALLGRVYFMDG